MTGPEHYQTGYVGWNFAGVGQAIHIDCDEVCPDYAAEDVAELLAAIDEHECAGLGERSYAAIQDTWGERS